MSDNNDFLYCNKKVNFALGNVIMQQTLSNKEKYVQFCEDNETVPLFLQPWWMDAVCNANAAWEVFLYEEKGKIRGVYVCYVVRKMGLKMIVQPQLTQYNGIWLVYDMGASANEKLHFEKRAIAYLVTKIEAEGYDYLNQNFPPSFCNWLPLCWRGYKQTTRYSYQIADISKPEACFDYFSYAKQKQIRKAEKLLQVSFAMDGKEFYKHLTEYYKSKSENLTYSEDFFLNLYDACKKRNRGEIISVADSGGTVHAALFVVWDNERAYNLISSIHPEYKSSGASSLVVFEAIKNVASRFSFRF